MNSYKGDTVVCEDRLECRVGVRRTNRRKPTVVGRAASITLAVIVALPLFRPVSANPAGPSSATMDDCGQCAQLSGNWHRAYRFWFQRPGVTSGIDGWHRAMRIGYCEETHPDPCVPTFAVGLTDEIERAVATRDVAKLASLVKTPTAALYQARSAIQIVGCDGETIIGHVPVSDDLFTAVDLLAAE